MDPDVEMSIEGRLVLPDGITNGVVGITKGHIVQIKKVLEGDVRYNMSNCLNVPAAVDMHVHIRQPGDPRKGTFRTESRAAIFGGVTTVADMPNNTPPTIDARSWNDKLASIRGESFVDYALYMGLTEGRDPALVGFTGLFKLYIASTTGDLLVRDERNWISALVDAMEKGARVVVHAEDQGIIEQAVPSGDPLDRHNASRPPHGEAIAVEKVAKAAVSTGKADHCHIAHLSCREALVALGDWGCSSEVAPHHLFLDRRRDDLGAMGKVNPPLRTDEDRAALWSALASGSIPIIASDHAPHTREEKARPFDDAPSGIPGVETMVPMAMVEALEGEPRRCHGDQAGRIPRPREEGAGEGLGGPCGRLRP